MDLGDFLDVIRSAPVAIVLALGAMAALLWFAQRADDWSSR